MVNSTHWFWSKYRINGFIIYGIFVEIWNPLSYFLPPNNSPIVADDLEGFLEGALDSSASDGTSSAAKKINEREPYPWVNTNAYLQCMN